MAKSLEELGHRVTAARRGQGLTQLELASAIEVDAAAIAKIEAGERPVDALELARLAKALRRPTARTSRSRGAVWRSSTALARAGAAASRSPTS